MGEGKGITFFIAGCVLWEICPLELTMPIKFACFHASCRVLESTKKKGERASQAVYSDRSGEEQDGKYLSCYLQLWDLPSIPLPCQNIHTPTCTFPEMCLEKIEGLFPIVLITPFLSHPCEARDLPQAIVWSSPTCFHRCEANTSWRLLLRAGLPQVTLCDGGNLKRQCFGRERHKSLKQSSLPGRVTLIYPAKDKEHDGSSVWGYLHFISEVTRERGVGEDTVFPGNLTHWHLLSWARCLMAKAAAISYNSEARLYFPICEHLGCTLRLLADSPSFPAVSPQSAPLPLAVPSHKGCQTASWARWQIQPAQRRGRWDGGRQCVLRARLLPFRGGMGAQDLCCWTWKINTWSPRALLVRVCYPANSNIHPSTLPWLILTTSKCMGEWALPHGDERRSRLPWDVKIPLWASC